MNWRRYLIPAFLFVIAACLFVVGWEVTNLCNELTAYRSHNHDNRYYVDTKVEDRLRFLRNDIKFYIDRERSVTTVLERLDLLELEASR